MCTEGAIHELFVHYIVMEDGVCTYKMAIQKICHALLLDTAIDFLVAFDNVCRWGTGKLLDSVVERLGMVLEAVDSDASAKIAGSWSSLVG